MKKILFPVLLAVLAITAGLVSAQSAEPTQTPYVIYIVVTATPEPIAVETQDSLIQRPADSEPITLVNGGSEPTPVPGEITIENDTLNEGRYAGSTEELVEIVVATVTAQTTSQTGGSAAAQASYSAAGGGVAVVNSDGSSCTMNFELVSEPTYPAGSIIPRGEVFWKEWLIRNTGTCTWTSAWEFVFNSGWQIGNTRFHMNRTTAPGETLNVRLAMVPDQKQNGNYYSTYIFEAPDGTQYGTITSSYTVQDPSYFAKSTAAPDRLKPLHGKDASPGPCWPYPCCPPPKY